MISYLKGILRSCEKPLNWKIRGKSSKTKEKLNIKEKNKKG